ncbi:MAG: TetR/AcrR family transcriptional regulator [Erysipelotrichaceae bacterium]|jgi:AcrR family transcriptional regulator|nr:TetR/AcrR family transcriptional regulator [Erysipelotrichaceae bacterium]
MNQKQLKTLQKNNEESREFTRNCISAALIVLLNKEKLENITITHLCHVAGVSRMAFYRNYNSIDEVLVDKIKEYAMRLTSQVGTDIYDNWVIIFKETEKDRQMFEILIKLGVEHKVHDVFMSLLPAEEENRTIQAMWLSLFYTLAIKWIKEGKPKKIEDAARIAYKYSKNIPLIESIS